MTFRSKAPTAAIIGAVALLVLLAVPASAVTLLDARTGAGSSEPTSFTIVGGQLFFVADDGVNGRELWISDGTADGTMMVANLRIGGGDANVIELTQFGDSLLFVADDRILGQELWISDGTDAGTVPIIDIREGLPSGAPSKLTVAIGLCFFTADAITFGRELWQTDGTGDGTFLIDLLAGNTSSVPNQLTTTTNGLFFTATDGISGVELWFMSDQSELTMIDIREGVSGSSPDRLTGLDRLFFRVSDNVTGREPWTSDGTSLGTYTLGDIKVDGASSDPEQFTAFAGEIYFSADDGTNGRELWHSDGTADSAMLVSDIRAGGAFSNPDHLTPVADTYLYFSADNGINGRELWRTDGTADGTLLVLDIREGAAGSSPENFLTIGDALFFTADDGINGRELWYTDITQDTATIVTDLRAGSAASDPDQLTIFNGLLYFVANDGTTGRELWKSNGTLEGTLQVADMRDGSANSNPVTLTTTNDLLFFRATDGVSGNELWVHRNTPPVVIGTTAYEADEDADALVIDLTTMFDDVEDGAELVTILDGTSSDDSLVEADTDGPLLTLSFKPDQNGVATVTVPGMDLDGDSTDAQIVVTVNPVNDVPQTVADTFDANENGQLVTAPEILTNDIELDGDDTTAVLVTDIQHGTLALALDGSFTYTPTPAYVGTDTFEYRADDGSELIADAATVTITVHPIPVAEDDAADATEDTPVIINVVLNDTAPDSTVDTTSVAITSPAASGTAVANTDGTVTYTPIQNFNGTDTFEYTINNARRALSAPATVTVTVLPGNDPPDSNDDRYLVNDGEELVVPPPGVLVNDSDIDGDDLTATKRAGGGGILSLDANGGFTYTTGPGFSSLDTFTYSADDGIELSNPSTVRLVRNAPPGAPNDSATTPEDTPIAINVIENDFDTDGSLDLDSIVITQPPGAGTAVKGDNGIIVYIPDANTAGQDTFKYTIRDDANGISIPATVTVNITAINDAPVATVPDPIALAVNTAVELVDLSAIFSDAEDTFAQLDVTVEDNSNTSLITAIAGAGNFLALTFMADTTGGGRILLRAEDTDGAAVETAVIVSVGDATTDLSVMPGWRLYALPLIPETADPAGVFGTARDAVFEDTLWSWNATRQQYASAEAVTFGTGYWLYSAAIDSVEITINGVPAPSVIRLSPGWNLVGPTGSGNFMGLTGAIPDCAVDHVWRWTGDTYELVDDNKLDRNQAYWVYAHTPCDVEFDLTFQ
jgi:ELWxxDGT repeat protein